MISKERADFLAAHFFEFSFKVDGEEEIAPKRELFDAITDPTELHYIAEIYNWGDGPAVLDWIVNSPLCDRGTAALIFWRAQPDDYTEYATEAEVPVSDGVLTLLQRLMHNWERGRYERQQIAYNRFEDPGAGKVYPDTKRKWEIPAYLLEPTKGQPFFSA